MKRTILLITLLYNLIVCTASGQSAYSVRHFTIRDGLAANAIVDVEQDHKGLIWIATWNGLCCYDGNKVSTFRGEQWGEENALSTFRLSAIKADGQDNIWIRTYDRELYLYDTHQCRFINIGRLVKRKFGQAVKPRNIYVMPSGHVWITDERAELNLRIDERYPTDTDRMEVWGKRGKALYGKYIQKVEADGQGREWIVTDRGMMRYGSKEVRKGIFTNYANGGKPAGKPAGTDAEAYVKANDIDKYMTDRQGNLWYWSSHGLSLVNFHHYDMQLLALEAGVQTRSVLCRRDGSTWAGTKNGCIGIYSSNGRIAGNEGGSGNLRLTGWLGTSGKPMSTKVVFSQGIYCMKEDSRGNVWIGTKGQGLYTVWSDGRAMSHYMPDGNDAYSLSNKNVYDIDEDEQGNIWIATYDGGLNLIRGEKTGVRGEKLRFIHSGNELKQYPLQEFSRIRRISHDGKGTILLSTTNGLVTFSNAHARNPQAITFHSTQHEQRDTTSLRTNDVLQTLVCGDGTVYVVTLGGGIQRIKDTNLLQDNLHLQTERTMNQGAGSVLSLLEDRRGSIWVVRETEVNRYDRKTGELTPFGPNSMGEQAELTEAQPAMSNDGHLWVAALSGVLTFDGRSMRKSNYQPNIVFTSLRYQGEEETHPILNRQTLTIEKDQRNMTIYFAALDYEDNYLMQYAYRIERGEKLETRGEKGWNYIGQQPAISFSELQPGQYRLIVKSTNSDGVWTSNETMLILNVVPTFWERGWVRLIAILLIIALGTWLTITYLSRRRQAQEREQRLASIMRQYRDLQERLRNEEREQEITPASTEEETDTHEKRIEESSSVVREYRLSEPQIVDEDEVMMNRLMVFIEEHINDEDLKIDDMAEAVGLGRTVFYERIKQLVGVSPSDFLRQVRMQRAQQLIVRSKMTVSEIAYSIGFTDPKYFTKCFKKLTGMTPSEYREKESAAN